jgi:hypothetical protein
MDGMNGFQMNGATDSQFGGSVTFADLNNDGYDEAIVGATNADAGYVSVIYGSPDTNAFPTTPFGNTNQLDGITGFTIKGEATGDWFGSSVSHADINNDGIDDLIIGSSDAIYEAGAVYVIWKL